VIVSILDKFRGIARPRGGVLLSLIIAASTGGVNANVLVGDAKLACEAILCLNPTGHVTPACHPSLFRFHTIVAPTPGRLLAKRVAFLRKCPVKMDIVGFLKHNESLNGEEDDYVYKTCIAPYKNVIIRSFKHGQCSQSSSAHLSSGEKNRLQFGNKIGKWNCSGSDITFDRCATTNTGFICSGKKEMPRECKDLISGMLKNDDAL